MSQGWPCFLKSETQIDGSVAELAIRSSDRNQTILVMRLMFAITCVVGLNSV